MANMQIPDGFVYNPSNGLYYSQIDNVDEKGNPIIIVTWYNPGNGQYSQEIINAAGQPVNEAQQPLQQNSQYQGQQYLQNGQYAQPVQGNYGYPKPVKKKSKGFLILMIVCLVILIGSVSLLVIYLSGSNEGVIGGFDRITINSNYDAAEEMYLEGDYAGAVEKYKKILKKNETEVDAYLGMATALYRLEEYDKAAEILAGGYAITNSDAILEKIAELKDLTGVDAM